MVWSSYMKFWQQFEIHKLFECAKLYVVRNFDNSLRFITHKLFECAKFQNFDNS